jgi:hypothetical protein
MSMSEVSQRVDEWSRRAVDWVRRAEWWQLGLVALFAFMVLPLVPTVMVVALLAALVLFARAWVREFVTLMRLDDEAFPGHNDKLIWAILLIVLPPVGVWMFGTYREAHWPEAKPTRGDALDA